MERDIGDDWFWPGRYDHDAKTLTKHLFRFGFLPILDLNAIISNYACTHYTDLPWPLPAPILSDQKVRSSCSWGELAANLPIGSIGLLQTIVHAPSNREIFYRGREVAFVVVDKPANPHLGTINVVILKLQRLNEIRLNEICEWGFMPGRPEDLSDNEPPTNRFAAVELWLDPQQPVQTCVQPHKFRQSTTAICVGTDDRYRMPILKFIDTTDSTSIIGFWAALTGLRPEKGESRRWYAPIQSLLQQSHTDRLNFHRRQ